MLLSILTSLGILRAGEPLAVGQAAPAVEAVDQDGKPVRFQDRYASGLVLVYFYPKADTSGCTAQACSLRDAYATLAEKGIQVIGVSGDSPAALLKFKEKYQLPFTLASDPDGKVMEAFGVPHRGGIAARQAFLIKNGKIVWLDFSASTKQQAADVLKAVEELG